jgi:hypothetical protein
VIHPLNDLPALLDGELAPLDRAEVAAHLTACEACRQERDRIAAAVALLAELPPPPAPSPGFAQRVEARLASGRKTAQVGSPGGRPRRWLWRGLACAAAAIAAVAAMTAIERQRELALAEHLELLERPAVGSGAAEAPAVRVRESREERLARLRALPPERRAAVEQAWRAFRALPAPEQEALLRRYERAPPRR